MRNFYIINIFTIEQLRIVLNKLTLLGFTTRGFVRKEDELIALFEPKVLKQQHPLHILKGYICYSESLYFHSVNQRKEEFRNHPVYTFEEFILPYQKSITIF